MISKHYLITGATSGIGFAATKILALREPLANFVFPSRDAARGLRIQNALRLETGNPNIYSFQTDLSVFSQVRQFAEDYQNRFQKIDVLINNAGIFNLRQRMTVDELEETYQVNYFSPFLLTHCLLPSLYAAEGPSVVNVSSVIHFQSPRFLPTRLIQPARFNPIINYAISKLALILWTYKMSDIITPKQIYFNAVHPGGVATEIGRGNGLLNLVMKALASSPEKGAAPILYLCKEEVSKRFSGKYFDREKRSPVQSSSLSYDTELGNSLYEWTKNYLNLS